MDSLKCGTVDNPNVSAANRANRTNTTNTTCHNQYRLVEIALFAGATAEIGCRSTTLVVITLKSAPTCSTKYTMVNMQIHKYLSYQTHIDGQRAKTQIHVSPNRQSSTRKYTNTCPTKYTLIVNAQRHKGKWLHLFFLKLANKYILLHQGLKFRRITR